MLEPSALGLFDGCREASEALQRVDDQKRRLWVASGLGISLIASTVSVMQSRHCPTGMPSHARGGPASL